MNSVPIILAIIFAIAYLIFMAIALYHNWRGYDDGDHTSMWF